LRPLRGAVLQFKLYIGTRKLAAEVLELGIEATEPFFTQTKRFLRFLVLGYVDARANKPEESPLLVEARRATIDDPVIFVVTVGKPVLHHKRHAAFNRGLVHGSAARQVF